MRRIAHVPGLRLKALTRGRSWSRVWQVAGVLMLAALLASDTPRSEARLAPQSLAREIDFEIDLAIADQGFEASPASDDATFFRRLHLDLAGHVPAADDVRAFLADDRTDKRARAIDRLLESPDFARHMADIWDDLLFDTTGRNSQVDRRPFTRWLEKRFDANEPWDETVAAILTAEGVQYENGAVTPFVGSGQPHEAAALVTESLMGVQLECAQCHDHPYAEYRQEDFWGMASFFRTMNRESKFDEIPDSEYFRAAMNVGVDIGISESGELLDFAEADGSLDVPPQFLGGIQPTIEAGSPRRPVLAKWLVSPDNPWFARSMVNRIWAQLMGRGLIDPVNDLKQANAPSHPALLNTLTAQFVAHDFDLKFIYRAICNSRAYQRSSRATDANRSDVKHYSRALIKVTTPEQVFESLVEMLGAHAMYAGDNTADDSEADVRFKGFRLREKFVEAMTADRGAARTEYRRGIPHALMMMNSREQEKALRDYVARIVDREPNAQAVIDRMYLATLSRYPTDAQRERAIAYVTASPEPDASKPMDAIDRYTGVLWALINSSEYALNH